MRVERLLFVVNVGWFFVSHRLPVAVAALGRGYDVHVATALDPILDSDTPRRLESLGLPLHQLRFSRSGAGPWELVRDWMDLIWLMRRIRPDVVHLVALKPLLLGGIAARFFPQCRVVMAIPGRGSVFSAKGPFASVRRGLVLLAYRLAYRPGRTSVIFQNTEDRDYFLAKRIFDSRDVALIRGSGVCPEDYPVVPEPIGAPVVLLVSRMLKEKGIADFVEAARAIKSSGTEARFVLVGEPDHGNPKSHTRAELKGWVAEGVVEWWGFRRDIPIVLGQASVVCLPTYYGEGLPKVLIEAAAAGRCIVTTDIPGCRDIVRHPVNGVLVEPRNVAQLVMAIKGLLEDPKKRQSMGRAGRELVEREFSLRNVTEQTLALYVRRP